MPFWRRYRIPPIRQAEHADCGPTALTMALRASGFEVTREEVRKQITLGERGTDALALVHAAKLFGATARVVAVDPEQIDTLPFGTILHWDSVHFVVLEGLRRNGFQIVDPSFGRSIVSRANFLRRFSSVAIIVEPRGKPLGPLPSRVNRYGELLAELRQERRLFARVISSSVVVQVLAAALPIVTGIVIDRVIPYEDYSLLLVLAIGYCVFQAVSAVLAVVRSQLMVYLRAHLEVRFTATFMRHLVSLPYSFFEKQAAGDLMVRVGSNAIVRDIVASAALSGLIDGTLAVSYLFFLAFIDLQLTGFVLLLAIARIALLAWVRSKQHDMVVESLDIQGRSQTLEIEILGAIETVKAMGLEQRMLSKWSALFLDGVQTSVRRGRLEAVTGLGVSVITTVTTLGLVFYGTLMVLNDTLTLGSMMAFNALAAGFIAPLSTLFTTALQLQMLEAYLERRNEVMDTAPESTDGPLNELNIDSLRGHIACHGVSFSYDAGRVVLQGVDLEVAPESTVALIGRTGSGKSTLSRLMIGLHSPDSGQVFVDGIDVRSLNRSALRQRIGIVTQEPQLFAGTISDNIRLSDLDMDHATVVEAATMACIHEDVAAMPLGYETVLTDRGRSLSGGQRQRLALARAIARRPAILVLDEATSNLDPETEARVNDNMRSLKCTKIIVAHRFGLVKSADHVLVLENGRVVQGGRHEELIIEGGAYARLMEAEQLS